MKRDEPGDGDYVLVLRFWRTAGKAGSFAQRRKIYEALRRGAPPADLQPLDAEPFVQEFADAYPAAKRDGATLAFGDLQHEDAPGFRLEWTGRDLLVRLVDPDDAEGLLELTSKARVASKLTGAPLNYEGMEQLFGWE